MKVTKNKYGDYLVQRVEGGVTLNKDKKIVLENENPMLFKGFNESNKPLSAEYVIVEDSKYGKLYGNYLMKKEHPNIINNTILSSCLVSFFKEDDVYYTILVRNKFHKGIMNARGSINENENDEMCAKREFIEETYIYPEKISKIGEWYYDTYFSNLKWNGICKVYYTELKAKEVCYKRMPTIPIVTEVNNVEIDAVIICPVHKLDMIEGISSHHIEAIIMSICKNYEVKENDIYSKFKPSKTTNHLKRIFWNSPKKDCNVKNNCNTSIRCRL